MHGEGHASILREEEMEIIMSITASVACTTVQRGAFVQGEEEEEEEEGLVGYHFFCPMNF